MASPLDRLGASHAEEGRAEVARCNSAPSSSGGRGHLPRSRRRLASRQPRPPEPRPVEGDERDRGLPHGGPRRACCALRRTPACSHTPIAYNSCRNRHCPKCQGSQASEWLEARKAELLEVPYFHVVFTLPPRIGAIAFQNKAVIYDLLFKASAETLLTIAADPKRLGVKIGFTSVLHTWGSAMTHHPHVHMIVPGGGISLDGSLAGSAASEDFLLPVPVLSRMFRGKMLAMLKAAHDAGRLQFFGTMLASPTRPRSRPGSSRSTTPSGTSMPSGHSPAPSRCWPISLATRTASRSPTSRLIRRRRERRHVQVQGLSDRRPRPIQDHDGGSGRVHPPLHAPRAAEGIPSHPALRAAWRSSKAKADTLARARELIAAAAAPQPLRRRTGSSTAGTEATDKPVHPCPCCGGRMVIIELFEAGTTPRNKPTVPAI